jgi:DNA invertase Pin-like site-specific DNA recombinase
VDTAIAGQTLRIMRTSRAVQFYRKSCATDLTGGYALGASSIEKLDRLARDLMVQEACIADLRKNGFTLVSVMEPDLMATDATRVLMRQLLGAVAQYEKTQIVIKLRAARTRMKAQEGRCEGRKPFGHYEGEQAAIERMQALAATGMSIRAIAAKLNAEGVPTRTGGQWRDAVVGRILKDAGHAPVNDHGKREQK